MPYSFGPPWITGFLPFDLLTCPTWDGVDLTFQPSTATAQELLDGCALNVKTTGNYASTIECYLDYYIDTDNSCHRKAERGWKIDGANHRIDFEFNGQIGLYVPDSCNRGLCAADGFPLYLQTSSTAPTETATGTYTVTVKDTILGGTCFGDPYDDSYTRDCRVSPGSSWGSVTARVCKDASGFRLSLLFSMSFTGSVVLAGDTIVSTIANAEADIILFTGDLSDWPTSGIGDLDTIYTQSLGGVGSVFGVPLNAARIPAGSAPTCAVMYGSGWAASEPSSIAVNITDVTVT